MNAGRVDGAGERGELRERGGRIRFITGRSDRGSPLAELPMDILESLQSNNSGINGCGCGRYTDSGLL